MTFGAATAGEVLVDRYRLEDHIDTDTAGRQIWRGVDAVLRRPVALVIRQPGGEAAGGMLTAAVAASRIVHPHLVSVYDAIDEGHRAYLVREWVPGTALRDILARGPLDADRATLVTHAVSEAVAALHNAGIVHGNIHPGTIIIADDGRVVLLDAHADAPTDPEYDVRAVGAVLYASLTGHWPYAEAGRSNLPDAPRDGHGRPSHPSAVHGGVPRHLDQIATELLDPQVEPPAAAALAGEFARLASAGDSEYGDSDYGGHGYDDEQYDYDDQHAGGPMGFRPDRGSGRRFGGIKLVAGMVVLVAIAAAGVYVGIRTLGGSPGATPTDSTPSVSASPSPVSTPLALTAGQVRIIDPPGGDRTEFDGVANLIDGDQSTGWSTDDYFQANFGGIKPGMGVLIDLGGPTQVTAVQVYTSSGGASITLKAGSTDPGNTSEGDNTIANTYTALGPSLDDFPGTNMVFAVPESDPVEYLLIWITELPPNDQGSFSITINEIVVLAP
jgi:hypothetical protein